MIAFILCATLILFLSLAIPTTVLILRADQRRDAWRAQAKALGLDREWRRIVRGRE